MTDYDNTNRGVVYINEPTPGRPHFSGTLNVEGKEYSIAIWEEKMSKGGKQYRSVTIQEPYAKQEQSSQTGYEKAKAVASSLKTEEEPSPINLDDIPF